METVLITGGTGLVGERLSHLLKKANYNVIHLSRTKNLNATFPAYQWDINKGYVDEEALTQADYIIHLAGAGIADSRWTPSRKKIILDSRIKSATLLQNQLKALGKQPKAVIAASAVGYYGNRGDELLTETASEGKGFLAEVVDKWEAASRGFEAIGSRTVLLRIGIVLSSKGGALAKMLPSYQFKTGTYFGDGSQYYSWIHLDDLCEMFIHALEKEGLHGVYNAVAPNPVTNKELAQKIADGLGINAVILPVPTFALKMAMGDMSAVVLEGAKVSCEKIKSTGFNFTFINSDSAVRDLIERNI